MPNGFPKWLYQFTLPPAMHESSDCSCPLQNLVFFIFSILVFVVVSHYDFNLHFPDDYDGECFFMCLLTICMSCEVSIQVFYPCLNWVVCLFIILLFFVFLLSCRRSVYILHISYRNLCVYKDVISLYMI